ncbi:MAG: CRISPR system precrRNA processing endoribonuclease RAMP protein Cas6 [Fimbriimonadaceae bacterium]|nr:CRISPR system precrRNA processing endoribonuclease RAMP protein Cas6 [Fimbriimonadaceae bacterium]
MPAACLLVFVTEDPAGWPAEPQHLLRGWHYRQTLEAVDPDLARRLHDDPRPGPVTLAVLPSRQRGELLVRLTTVQDDLEVALAEVLGRLLEQQQPVRLAEREGRLVAWTGDAADHPLVGSGSYSQLAAARSVGRWTLRLHTPTTFRSHEADLPLPVPEKLARSWLKRWQLWAPPALATLDDDLPRRIDRGLSVVDFQLRYERHGDGRYPLGGCVGEVVLQAGRSLDPADGAAFDTLARFAFWAGTGRESLRGMGVTSVRAG